MCQKAGMIGRRSSENGLQGERKRVGREWKVGESKKLRRELARGMSFNERKDGKRESAHHFHNKIR